MKKRQKKLNVGNTDRHFNINLVNQEEEPLVKLVEEKDKEQLTQHLASLSKRSRRLNVVDEQHYKVDYTTYMDDYLFSELCKHGGYIDFHTDNLAPYYVIQQLSTRPACHISYAMQYPFTREQKHNMELAFTATETVIEVDVALPNLSPYTLLFELHDLKTNVDKVVLNFPLVEGECIAEPYRELYQPCGNKYQLTAEARYRFFKYIQDPLSIWCMNIYLNCEDSNMYEELSGYVKADKEKRSSAKR